MKECQPLEQHVQKVRALSVYDNNLFKISHTAEQRFCAFLLLQTCPYQTPVGSANPHKYIRSVTSIPKHTHKYLVCLQKQISISGDLVRA